MFSSYCNSVRCDYYVFTSFALISAVPIPPVSINAAMASKTALMPTIVAKSITIPIVGSMPVASVTVPLPKSN